MKIIKIDAILNETVSDVLIADHITSEYYGEIMVQALIKDLGYMLCDFTYKLVEDDYELYRYENTYKWKLGF